MHTLTPTFTKAHQQPTILAIEDDADNLFYLSSALNLFNYRCLTAHDATKGLLLARTWQPDLILLDVRMPQTSGIELVKILKFHCLTQDIPVVAVTALAREKEKKLIFNAGFNDYLVKPYLLEDLEKVICANITNTSLCKLSRELGVSRNKS